MQPRKDYHQIIRDRLFRRKYRTDLLRC